jgi:hypothetical protein
MNLEPRRLPEPFSRTSLVVATLVLACGIAIVWHRTPSPDILWFLDVARRVATGQVLYRDILEVNPPLIIWLVLPFTLLSHPLPAYLGAVILLTVFSSVMTARALRGSWTLPVMLTVLLIVPIGWFAQREHLAIAMMLPWLVATLRPSGAKWPLGILAGLGFALKPPLLLAFLLIVLFRRRIDPGSRAVLLTLVAYAVAVAALAPGYPSLARSLGSDYWAYQRVGLPDLLWRNPCAWLAATGPVAWLLIRSRTEERTHGDGLVLATLGFLAGAVVQSKGWNYHYAPSVTTSLFLLGFVAARPLSPAVLLTRFVSAAIAFGFVQQAWRGYHRSASANPWVVDYRAYQRLVQELGDAGHPKSLLAIYRHSGQAFALTAFGGARFVSPFPMLWILDSPGWETKLPWWTEQIARAATQDPPDLILFSRDTAVGSPNCAELLPKDPAIAALLARYDPRPDAGGYRVFVSRSRPAPTPASE